MDGQLTGRQVGPYRLGCLLGRGGMGEVYAATHEQLERPAAIKVIAADGTQEHVKRFLNEARLQAKLQHPDIVRLYEFLELDGRPCIVMERAEGESLDEIISRHGPLSTAQALHVVRRLALALSYIHANGVVHRDIKSSNVKLAPGGAVKLLDFGIARSQDLPRLTQAGFFVGTIQYASPEQLAGRDVDQRADVWSLGVLLYEMVTGQLPFEGNSVTDVMLKIRDGKYRRASRVAREVSPAVSELIDWCLQPEPGKRYANTAELIRAMDSVEQPQRRVPMLLDWWLWAAGGVVVAAFIYLFLPTARSVPERAVEPTPQHQGTIKTVPVTIDSPSGRVTVWRDGTPVGVTPWTVRMPVGERVEVVLRRSGYIDRPVRFQVRDLDNEYSYPLHRAR